MEIITKNYLTDQADAIRFEYTQAAQNIVSIGQRLMEVQDRLEYGEFMLWVKDEFGWSKSQAYRFIDTAKNFLDFPTLGNFDKSALYLLSAPSTPEPARVEAKQLAATGKPVTHKAAKQIVAKHKEPEPVEKPTPVPAQAPTPTPVTPEPAKAVGVCYSFTQAWNALSKHQQNQINGYPGSMSAIEAFHAISVGAPTE